MCTSIVYCPQIKDEYKESELWSELNLSLAAFVALSLALALVFTVMHVHFFLVALSLYWEVDETQG